MPDLVSAALDTHLDALFFYPYLYYPTVRLIERAPGADRPASGRPTMNRRSGSPSFPPVFEAADGLVFQTAAERDLVQQLFPVATHRQLLLGLGVDDRAAAHPDGAPVGDVPYLVCLGPGRGAQGHPRCWHGCSPSTNGADPGRSDWCWPVRWSRPPPITATSTWSDRCPRTRSGACWPAPGPWCHRRPGRRSRWSWPKRGVLRTPGGGHRRLRGPTVEHCRSSGGGLSFADYGEFEAILEPWPPTTVERARLGERGRAYVDRWFRWPRVMDRYAAFVESVATRVAGSQIPPPSGRGPGGPRPGTPRRTAPGRTLNTW